ncbi:MAG: GLUG motif-containing protein, partial [Clostridia bacterium]|nr:GLUG motif-containing protein [Clostridia bacterium]
YILTNDITLTEEWTPIGVDSNSPFTGILDGNGYSVLGMSITSENSGYVGFVGYNQGTIRNLNLGIKYTDEIADTTGKAVINVSSSLSSYTHLYVGGLAAYNDTDGVIINCEVASYITVEMVYESRDMYTGGIAGYNNGSVTESYLITELETSFDEELLLPGTEYRGAFVGFHALSGVINDCRYERIVPSADFVSVACGNQNDEATFGQYSATFGSTTQDEWDV